MGADEFVDVDGDGLPDWWERKYFGSLAAGASDDPDRDGLTNLQEYERYSSNPTKGPYYVSAVAGSDAFDGRAEAPDGAGVGPKKTIQAALDEAGDGDTVLVLAGTYSGSGNCDLDYNHKAMIVRSQMGAAATVMDCGSIGRAVNPDSIGGAFAVLDGVTVRNGRADYGGAMRVDQSRFMLKECVVAGNTATGEGGGLYSYLGSLKVDGLSIDGNTAPDTDGDAVSDSDAGIVSKSAVGLEGDLNLNRGTLVSRSGWFEGSGTLRLGSGAVLEIAGAAGDPPTVVRTRLNGEGTIEIHPGQQLVVSGDAVVDLTDGQGHYGNIVVNGTLVAQDRAAIQNSYVDVKQASIKTDAPIEYNDIFMIDALGAGGEFFVEGFAKIRHNIIRSQGDRYLDLDPDPSASHPTITDNRFQVDVHTDPSMARGTLLELRARDYECELGGANPTCKSGAIPATVTGRFVGEAAENWMLETLEVRAGAKLNLTNRPGFRFRTDTAYPESVYVKTLKLHPGAILNTALQAIYYEELVLADAAGAETVWTGGGPPYPEAFDNGARIVDVPLLGFSLGIIAMNDTTASPFNEFDIRIRQRLRDPNDSQYCLCDGVCEGSTSRDPSICKEGSVVRLPDARDAGDGVMEMKTRADGKQPASSVAAKGSFARAGDEDIVIAFEYLFQQNPGAELIVKLSDKQDVGDRSFEVARVRVPPSGVAGSIGSSQFAIFYAQFPRVTTGYTLNFTRGTYVELELVASRDDQNNLIPSVVWIDNLDPQVTCSGYECASYDGLEGVTSADFLVLLGAYGRTLGSGDPKSCLDSKLARDHYVDVGDLLSWDTLFEGQLNACGTVGTTATKRTETLAPQAAGITLPTNTFLVAGKPNGSGEQPDAMYPVSPTGGSSGASLPPGGGAGSHGNGRLVRDNEGTVYQIHGTQGLIRLKDGAVMIPSPPDRLPTFDGKTVYVGVRDLGTGEFAGASMTDAVIRVTGSETYAYVVPVLVSVPDDTPPHSYKAAAKLKITSPGQYTVEQLYGADPYHDPLVTTTPPEASPYNAHSPREIELDRSGTCVFVVSAFGLNDNDRLLIYNEATAAKQDVPLSGLAATLKGPTALLASSTADKLYLTSTAGTSLNGAYVYRLTFNPAGPSVSLDGAVELTGMRQITAICQRPGGSTLYVTGFAMPAFPEDKRFEDSDPIFTTPCWAQVPADVNWSASPVAQVASQPMGGSDLALPVSAVFTAGVPSDFDGDGDVDLSDFGAFRSCFNGPNRPPAQAGCDDKDLDADADVDLTDFGLFRSCFNGPNRSPACP